MTVSHASITDPDIHESKGVVNAPTNSVYVATGTGTGNWTVLPNTDVSLIGIPVGFIIGYAGSVIPSKWLECYGQAVSRSTYSSLFSVLGTLYGVGDGTTTFNIPDLRGRVVAGWDLAGGISGNRLTTAVNGDVIASVGGSEEHTLIASEVPSFSGTTTTDGSHTHSINNGGNVERLTGGGDSHDSGGGITNLTASSSGSHSHSVTVNSGGDNPHINIQPTIIMNSIIYTGVA